MTDGVAVKGLMSSAIVYYFIESIIPPAHRAEPNRLRDDGCGLQRVKDGPSHKAAHVNVLNSSGAASSPSWEMFTVCV